MKRRLKIAAIALMMISSTHSYAGSNSSVEIKITGVKTITLVLNDINNQIKIQLKDKAGFTLYKEALTGVDTYAKLYNVSALPDGTYYFELDYGMRIKFLPINIKGGQVYQDVQNERELFKPTLLMKNSQLSISLFSPAMKALHIGIFDDAGNLVHQDNLKGELSLGKRYDLSKLLRGTYRVTLTSDGRSYNHYVEI